MLRDKWIFQFAAKKLADACFKKLQFHKERLSFWTNANAKVMEEIKSSGIEVSESMAGGNYSTSRMTPQVMVRNDLQEKLTECHQKMKEHNERIREYKGWEKVLQDNERETLSLNADDYLFFYGE